MSLCSHVSTSERAASSLYGVATSSPSLINPTPPGFSLMLLSLSSRLVSLSSSASRRPALLLIPLAASTFLHPNVSVSALRRNPAGISSARMASGGQKLPPQKQDKQPGKEHTMDPTPESTKEEYKPADKLQGKVALVSGGDSGIGRAVCYLFAKEGATVAFTYVKNQEDKDAGDTLEMLRRAKKSTDAKDPIAIPADLGYEENCKKVVEEVVNGFGRIDILVNNAAEQYERPSIADITEESLERVFRTNIFSYFFLSKHALATMKEGSCIINTTSVNAYKGNATLIDYTSTKGAIVAFTRALALQLAEKGIRVNGVAPGPIWTALIPASFPEEKVASFGTTVPMKRPGQPNEVAPSFVFLASNRDSSYITGQVLHPNGGTIVNA